MTEVVVGSLNRNFHRPPTRGMPKGARRRRFCMPSSRRSIAMLMAAISFATVLTHQHHLSKLALLELDGRNEQLPMRTFHGGSPASSLHSPPPREDPRLRLRYDWTNLSPSLDLTRQIQRHQSNCSLPMVTFNYRNRFGLGSDLHVYGQALGYGIETHRRIRTVGNWTWMDESECGGGGRRTTTTTNHGNKDPGLSTQSSMVTTMPLGSPMRCYFAASELNCPGDLEYAMAHPDVEVGGLTKANGNLIRAPPASSGDPSSAAMLPWKKDPPLLELAVVESLFTRLTPLVVKEAERQLNLVFGGKDRVPKDLITLHIRWGDKVATFERANGRKRMPEMKKVGISDYIDAIHQILDQREKKVDSSSESTTRRTANIYLATEDPQAVMEFQKALPDGWNLYVDQFLVETSSHRVDEYNGSPKMAKDLKGRAGLLALGSLLVAMEANDFVLTTKSNWSQLMDELRRAILDPRCGNCTSMIDLRPKR